MRKLLALDKLATFDRCANLFSLFLPQAAVENVAFQVLTEILQTRKISPSPKERRDFLVAGTGRGCPVDTSVRSAEAPTEAAAETLNLLSRGFAACPLAVPEKIIGLALFLDFFDRYANNALLHRPQDACGVVAPDYSPFGLITRNRKFNSYP